jgi:phosphate acetyltransferase
LEELLDSLYLAYDSFKVKDVEVLAVIANKVQPENIELVTNGLKKSLKSIVNSIPLIHNLNNPTVGNCKELDAKVLFGSAHLNNQTGNFSVVPCNCVIIFAFKENSLVITPGDRADIILGALQANESLNYPTISELF